MSAGWIGVDLDGTLAHYESGQGIDVIGEPIAPMVDRVREWLSDGKEVRIVTARVSGSDVTEVFDQIAFIKRWCERHVGRRLFVTNEKDFSMIELWDDRCITVEQNTGRILTVREEQAPEVTP